MPVITGTKLPVVSLSHGTAGSLGSHYDTALALAEAGFVVMALTHRGDNYQDQSYAGNRIDLTDRPRQLKQVIRFVLEEWSERVHEERSATRAHLLSAWKQVRSAERLQVTPNSRIAGRGTQLKECVFGNIYGVTFGVRYQKSLFNRPGVVACQRCFILLRSVR